VERARAALEGVRLVSMTGLSGAGKTEMVIWNLEAALAAQGHQVVSLDAQQLIKRADSADLLGEIDDVVRPTVVIFDESLYIRGPRKSAFLEFAERFLEWTVPRLRRRRESPGPARRDRRLAVPSSDSRAYTSRDACRSPRGPSASSASGGRLGSDERRALLLPEAIPPPSSGAGAITSTAVRIRSGARRSTPSSRTLARDGGMVRRDAGRTQRSNHDRRVAPHAL
jgi:hypothetical protein